MSAGGAEANERDVALLVHIAQSDSHRIHGAQRGGVARLRRLTRHEGARFCRISILIRIASTFAVCAAVTDSMQPMTHR